MAVSAAGRAAQDSTGRAAATALQGGDSVPPRIEEADAGGQEVGAVARDDAESVHERRRCDQCIPLGATVRHMQARAAAGDFGVDGQDAAGKRREHLSFQPLAQALP